MASSRERLCGLSLASYIQISEGPAISIFTIMQYIRNHEYISRTDRWMTVATILSRHRNYCASCFSKYWTGTWSPVGMRNSFSSLHCPDRLWGPPRLLFLYSMGTGASFSGWELPMLEADCSPPSDEGRIDGTVPPSIRLCIRHWSSMITWPLWLPEHDIKEDGARMK
jgi:hypothetical protein